MQPYYIRGSTGGCVWHDTNSTAGPDGFNALFYQRCWEVIHYHLLEAVKDFMMGKLMPKSFTFTSITLIPTFHNPTKWGEFGPISLSNTTKKICSKLLNEHLKHWLPQLISPNQCGFVTTRQISDNILLAQEIIHSIASHKFDWNVALKLDLTKIYDRVNWSFLREVFNKFDFLEASILLRLRQGDPLSLSLFVLMVEYLSHGINKLMAENPSMNYQGSMGVSHLSYIDDTIIFTNAKLSSLRKIMNFLQRFVSRSGQLVNAEKSVYTLAPTTPMLARR
ncbi:hypothetical protein Sango_1577000 [Sesamum angolense]|uniref:Reverse transcriptase domain-containing protein n=1 Tax=Sesamum angolense TaxID=2727404 RepID=A0AAE1WQ11_9LAMI|nr:hypothetical protein Sango_1577000 [Sesamum angolense]